MAIQKRRKKGTVADDEAAPANDAMATTLTSFRVATSPYLPPPLVLTARAVDVYFIENYPDVCSSDYVQNEPSVAFFGAWLVAYVLYRSLRGANQLMGVGGTMGKRSTLHLNKGDDVMVGLSAAGTAGAPPQQADRDKAIGGGGDTGDPTPYYGDTVVLCGASGSGKTALLHYLCRDGEDAGKQWRPPTTVTSLVTNAGYVRADAARSAPETASKGGCVRVIDYPGHSSFASRLPELLVPGVASRIVLTMDTSRPVVEGAGILYRSILVDPNVRSGWSAAEKTLPVLIACTKRDVDGSKNWKRMKIQIRNELDRLRKLDSAVAASGGLNGDAGVPENGYTLSTKGKSVDLENLGADVPVSLHFVEVGWDDGSEAPAGLQAVQRFVLTGAVSSAK